ncbi:MAG: DUF2878 domain-containing protein [Gammaproteobacteria bacterium]|nr:DUF2878 domain-containing protein [Gammaproteobacteria bacterium]MCW8988809.1 DUF2878 domain-containing protein [Gammaproteobacteria bacterium]
MNYMILNIVLFQLGWFACVLSAASNQPMLGAIAAVIIISIHLFISKQYKEELRIIAIAMVIGLVWDSLIVSMGWITYQSGMVFSFLAPYWIVLMWALFATTLNFSMSWLKGKVLLAAIFGAVAGPLAYYAGVKLGAVEFNNVMNSLISLSIGWAIFTPLLLKISKGNLSPARNLNGEVKGEVI